jgi:hypothetical protein
VEAQSDGGVELHRFGVLEGHAIEADVVNRRHAAREGGEVTGLRANARESAPVGRIHGSLLAGRMTDL